MWIQSLLIFIIIMVRRKEHHIWLAYINDLAQGCDNSSDLAMELPQSCIKPLEEHNKASFKTSLYNGDNEKQMKTTCWP